MLDVGREDIVGGSIPRVLLVLAAPLVAQNFALVAQEVVDLFWVGRLNADAVAAVGLGAVLVGLAIVPITAITRGTQIVTSQRVGADEQDAARLVPVNGAGAAVLIATVIGLGLVVFARDLASIFLSDPRVVGYAADYLVAYSLALVAIGASDSLEFGFTGWGDTRAALWVNLTAIVVNIVLDPLLILGWGPFPRWEMHGAAIATAIGYACGALLALGLGWRGRHGYELTREAFRVDVPTIRKVVEVGAPIGGQNAGRQVARLLMVGIVAAVAGAAGLAAYHVGSRVATIAFVPASGLGQASTSMVGQNLGADRPDRARRTTWVGVAVAAVGLSVFAAVQWLFPTAIARLFVPDLTGQGLAYAVLYLEILAYGYWALGAIYTLEAGFNGASRTDVSMYATLLQYWTVRLPIAAVGAFVLTVGVEAVFWAVTLSNVAGAVGLGVYYWHSTSNGMLRRAAEEAGASAAD